MLGETYTIAITSDRAPVEIIAEVADPSGAGVGTITRLPDEMLDETDLCESGLPAATLVDEPTRTIAAITPCGSSRLRFEWTAPTLAAQGIVLHVAAVVSDESEDPTGDGVFAAEYALVEQETEERANVGACSVTGRTGQSELARWLVLILLAAPAMRRAKTRRNRC